MEFIVFPFLSPHTNGKPEGALAKNTTHTDITHFFLDEGTTKLVRAGFEWPPVIRDISNPLP